MAKWIRTCRFPRDSGPHRIACKALYRALLTQCSKIPLHSDLPSLGPVHPLKHLVRKGFKGDQYENSERLVVKKLQVGYNALELLKTANAGSTVSLCQIHRLIHNLHSRRLSTSQPHPPRPLNYIPRVWAYPNAPQVLETRPLPSSHFSDKKKRHVPTLTQTNGYPFLRIKARGGKEGDRGMQSAYLTRVLGDKIKQKHRRFERIWALEEEERKGVEEDAWERVLERHGAVRENREAGWGKEAAITKREIWQILDVDAERALNMGRMMMKVRDKEERLWEQEIEERKKNKKEKRSERKRKSEVLDGDAPRWEEIRDGV